MTIAQLAVEARVHGSAVSSKDSSSPKASCKQRQVHAGTHVPKLSPDRIRDTRPDYVFILPWNLKDEISGQMSFIGEWGGRFIVPIPEPQIL